MGPVPILLFSLVMMFGCEVRGQTESPTYSGDYIILAPNTVHPGLDLTLSIDIIKTGIPPVAVSAAIVRNGADYVIGATTITAGSSGRKTLKMPSDAQSGSYQLRVSLSGGLTRKEELQTLEFKNNGFAILVQTDKAIYKPGQTIMFRAMAVKPDLKPYTGVFDIEMKDPDGNIVKQWTDLQNMEYGVVSGEMFTSDEARLGDWVIKVTANGQDYEHNVEVSEYVLPKFEVKFILPPFGTESDTEFAGMLEAKYTYGQPVKGTATVTVTYEGRWYAENERRPSIVRSNIKVDGTGDIRLTMDEVKRAFDLDFANIYSEQSMKFHAEVTETLTGIKQEGTGSIPINKHPIKLTEVTGNPESFKPGLLYIAYVSVAHIDDSPLTEAERAKGVIVKIGNSETPRSIPPSGIVKLEIATEKDVNDYTFKVYYSDYPPEDPWRCDQGCVTKTVRPSESPSNNFLQLTTDSSDLAAGDMVTFRVLSSEVPGTLQYQIISRGDIVHTDSITASTTDTLLQFEITPEMAPSPRLLVYYIRDADGELILDSINFKASGVFENDVTITADMEKVEPGHDVNLDITASANSFIGILAIDQSVRLLKTGNDIDQQQVIEALNEFDTTSSSGGGGFDIPFRGRRRRDVNQRSKRSVWCPWCWFPIGGTTVREVIDNAGVLVFTDGLVYEKENTEQIFAQAEVNKHLFAALDRGDLADEAVEENHIVTDLNPSPSKLPVRVDFRETWL